ncbi:hypothetical protein [Brucella anthropi]|uniref:hypothetical protein n=1 Tax=Brucella anthropi TaxID=529 RepID=UPI00178C2B11|nr:hypothetical protein [Brucella anthropi]
MGDPVKQAAIWLATTPDAKKPRPIIPFIKSKFGLSAVEAIRAIEESNLIKARTL